MGRLAMAKSSIEMVRTGVRPKTGKIRIMKRN
jgi:hypothetical protein